MLVSTEMLPFLKKVTLWALPFLVSFEASFHARHFTQTWNRSQGADLRRKEAIFDWVVVAIKLIKLFEEN